MCRPTGSGILPEKGELMTKEYKIIRNNLNAVHGKPCTKETRKTRRDLIHLIEKCNQCFDLGYVLSMSKDGLCYPVNDGVIVHMS